MDEDARLIVALAELAGYRDVVCTPDPDQPGVYIISSEPQAVDG